MSRHAPDTLPPRSVFALWLGILGPPLIWLSQFEIKYALAGAGHPNQHTGPLIATSVVAAALVLMLAMMATRERRAAAASPLDIASGGVGRNRFMATLGLMSATLFLLLIVAQAVADFFIPPGTT
jgi:hypothetical protein